MESQGRSNTKKEVTINNRALVFNFSRLALKLVINKHRQSGCERSPLPVVAQFETSFLPFPYRHMTKQ